MSTPSCPPTMANTDMANASAHTRSSRKEIQIAEVHRQGDSGGHADDGPTPSHPALHRTSGDPHQQTGRPSFWRPMAAGMPAPRSSAIEVDRWDHLRMIAARCWPGMRSQLLVFGHLPGLCHPVGPPAAPRRPALAGRLRRRCRCGPSGGPTEASMIFRRRRLDDGAGTVSFGGAQGLLAYWVLQPERMVVLLNLTWAG